MHYHHHRDPDYIPLIFAPAIVPILLFIKMFLICFFDLLEHSPQPGLFVGRNCVLPVLRVDAPGPPCKRLQPPECLRQTDEESTPAASL